MNKGTILLISLFLVHACVNKYEDGFARLAKVDYSELCDYMIQQRNGWFYRVLYEDSVYLAKMPIDSSTLLSISKPHYYYDIEHMEEKTIKELSSVPKTDSLFSKIENICLQFRKLCEVNPNLFYIQTLAVNEEHDILISGEMRWYKHFDLIITNKDSIDHLFDNYFDSSISLSYNDFTKIGNRIYYRIMIDTESVLLR